MRDAQEAEFPSTKYPRLEPHQELIWIRFEGEWRRGRITKWVHDLERGHWAIWARHDIGRPYSGYIWLVYDPETIRQRADNDEAPPES